MTSQNCPKCLVSVSGSYRFCPECGVDLQQVASETSESPASDTSEVSKLRVQMDDNLSMDQIERLGVVMAGIDFTRPNSAQAIENALKNSMPDLAVEEPVITGTSKSLTITSRSGPAVESSAGQSFRETASPRECQSCGREASEGLQFCLGCGADLDSPPPDSPPPDSPPPDNPQPRQAPKFSNDWAQPPQLEEKDKESSPSGTGLLVLLVVLFSALMLLGAAATMYLVL